MKKRIAALSALLTLAVAVLMGAENRFALDGGFTTSIKIDNGVTHTGDSIRYFAPAGSVTVNRDSMRTVSWITFNNTKNGQVNVRLYGRGGTSGAVGSDTSYTTIALPPLASLTMEGGHWVGINVKTDPDANGLYIVARR